MKSKLYALTFAALISLILICPCGSLQSSPLHTKAHKNPEPVPRAEDVRNEIANRKQVSEVVNAQYHFDVWTTDNGLPQNSVSAILQTRDGFLWLTTNDGLVRYDGVNFTIFSASNTRGLKNSRFSQLFEDREGTLWIITEDNKLISYKDGLFTTFTKENGLPRDRVWGMRNDEDGSLLLHTSEGLLWWKDGKFVPNDPIPNCPRAGFGFPARPGVVWYLDDAGLSRVENGQVTAHAKIGGLSLNDIKRLYEDRKGELWVGITGSVLMRFRDGKLTSYSRKDGLSGDRLNYITEDRLGNLWIGSWTGLTKYRDGVFTPCSEQYGVDRGLVTALMEDREGGLWIGTLGGGATRFKDGRATSYTPKEGLPSGVVRAIHQDRQGAIWFGTSEGLCRFKDGVFSASCDGQRGRR